MLRHAILVVATIVAVTAVGAIADESPVSARMDVMRVVVATDGTESLQPADEARPNDTIEYRLTYRNNSESPIRNLAITDAIPSGTVYVGETATTNSGLAVEFSINGGASYHDWPIRIKHTAEDGTVSWQDATPEMVTHIRWTVAEQFAPESEVAMSYRTIVK